MERKYQNEHLPGKAGFSAFIAVFPTMAVPSPSTSREKPGNISKS
jgi:hypothetical protein